MLREDEMIYGLLLAAGRSTRMGQPKQLLDWRGQPLVRHIANVALASRLAGLVVVVGAESAAVIAALDGLVPPPALVFNPEFVSGQASSLRAGLLALPAEATGALVLLVDQPLISAPLIDQLLVAALAQPTALAVVPTCGGQRGNPVLLRRQLFRQAALLEGDTGARPLLQAAGEAVLLHEVADRAILYDADDPAAFAQLRARTP